MNKAELAKTIVDSYRSVIELQVAEKEAVEEETEIEKWIHVIRNFDHTFEYTDDHAYAIKTRARYRSIKEQIALLPEEYRHILQEGLDKGLESPEFSKLYNDIRSVRISSKIRECRNVENFRLGELDDVKLVEEYLMAIDGLVATLQKVKSTIGVLPGRKSFIIDTLLSPHRSSLAEYIEEENLQPVMVSEANMGSLTKYLGTLAQHPNMIPSKWGFGAALRVSTDCGGLPDQSGRLRILGGYQK